MKRLVCDSCGASETVDDNADGTCPMCGDRMELLYSTDPLREATQAARALYRGLEDLLRATLSASDAEYWQVEAQHMLDRYTQFADAEDSDEEVSGGDEVELPGGERGAGDDDGEDASERDGE
jgi:hypothetical protein